MTLAQESLAQEPAGPPGPSVTASPAGEPPATAQMIGRRWRRSRGILIVVLALIGLALAITALRPAVEPQYLDPGSPGQDGTRALARILEERGTTVHTARNAATAADRVRTTPDVLLVVTRSERLTSAEVDRLRGLPGDVLLIEPSRDTLRALAPGIAAATRNLAERDSRPGCGLPAATLAGALDLRGSTTYEAPGGATRCYLTDDDLPQLVQYRPGDRTITVLGTGAIFTNADLAEGGNAALGLNLLGGRSSLVWLIPDLPEPGSAGGDRTPMDLVPFGVKLAVLQLLIAIAVVALWRSRRLGPVVAEPLPIAVRSAEAVEGRARLYRAHRATGSAADALRAGTRERLVTLLGLPRAAAQDPAMMQEIVMATAARTGLDTTTVGTALYGPAPVDDAALVRLTDFLDDLERQVRQS